MPMIDRKLFLIKDQNHRGLAEALKTALDGGSIVRT